MDRYIGNLRKTKSSTDFLSKLNFLSSSKVERVPDIADGEVHIEYKEPSIFRKMMMWSRRYRLREAEEELSEEEIEDLEDMEAEIEAIEDEETALEDMEEEFEGRREGLLSKLMRKLNIFKRGGIDDFDEEAFEAELEKESMRSSLVSEDVKEVLKIAHSWIEKLPDKQKKEFKSSSDFEKYKTILVKYGLVKEKPKLEVKGELKKETKTKK